MKYVQLFAALILFVSPAFGQGSSHSSMKNDQGIGLVLNFPHIYTLSYERLHRESYYSWAIGAGFLPTVTFPSGTSQIGLSMSSIDVRARLHPFRGGFFLGMGLGYLNMTASGSQNIDVSGTPVPTLVEVGLKNAYVLPHMGWLWTPGNVMFGFEFGAAIGFGGNSTVNMSITDPSLAGFQSSVQSTTSYQNLQRNVQDGFNKFGNSTMAYAAIRLGIVF